MSITSKLLGAASKLPGPLGSLAQGMNLATKVVPSVMPKPVSASISPGNNRTSTVSAPKAGTPAFLQPSPQVATSASISAAYPRASSGTSVGATGGSTPRDQFIAQQTSSSASNPLYARPGETYEQYAARNDSGTPFSGSSTSGTTNTGSGNTTKTGSVYSSAAQTYLDSLKENPRVTSARKAYQDFIYNRDKASNTLETAPIAMAYIRGNQQALLRNTQLDANRLLDEYQGEQEMQTGDRAYAKAAYDISAAESKPIQIGDNLVVRNPQTGEFDVVYQAPASSEGYTLSPGQTRFDANGNPIASLPATPGSNGTRNPNRVLTIDEATKLGVPIGTTEGQVYGMVNPKTYTETQYKAAGFAQRMQQSGDIIQNLAQQIAGSAPGTWSAQEYLPNRLRSTEYQQFDQAARDFINAKLRQESGAVISPEEFQNAKLQYLPQPGDSPEVLAQKQRNRDTVFNDQIRQSAGAYEDPAAAQVQSIISQGGDPGSIVNRLLQPGSPVAGQVRALQTAQKPSGGGYSPEEIVQLIDAQYDTSPSFSYGGGGGNRPQRNNNPGNVKAGGVADQYAIDQDEQGHLIFPSAEAGFQALAADLGAKVSGRSQYLPANPTIAQLGKIYAEDGSWGRKVAAILGVPVNTPTQMIDFNRLMDAVATQEGFYA